MNDIATMIRTPTFWFAVVLMGIAVSIVGNLFTDGLKRNAGRLSKRYRERIQRGEKDFQERAERLAGDPHSQVLTAIQAVHTHINSAVFLLIGPGIVGGSAWWDVTTGSRPLGILGWTTFVSGLLSVLVGLQLLTKTVRTETLVDLAVLHELKEERKTLLASRGLTE
jgi:hypothetical protein